MAGCEAGHVDLDNNPVNGCEYACVETGGEDLPDPGLVDANCDGIDGDPSQAVFVAPFGSKNNPGTMAQPVDSVVNGIARAKALNKPHVYVAAGTYSNEITMVAGIHVYGGYSTDGSWARDPTLHQSILTNDTVGTQSAIRVVIFDGITTPTVLAGVTISAGNNTVAGGSSYGIWMHSVSANVVVRNTRIFSGNGAPGTSAGNQSTATSGVTGADGETTTDSDCYCNEFNTYGGEGGDGADGTCPNGDGAGGDGADSTCGDKAGKTGSPSPGGTLGGAAQKVGKTGANGSPGVHGEGGLAAGSVNTNGFWTGDSGEPGGDATHGKGGGGGGSGGGDDGGFWCAIWGGGGGGGGSAGCGGQGAASGSAGGGSFAIFLYDASPQITMCTVSHKNGGAGGKGGKGGTGGTGKIGGTGGKGHSGAGNGGAGGPGGNGGHGGHGGGGAGGSVFGIFSAGTSQPTCNTLSFQPLGSPGTGGVGGDATGKSGNNGQSGDMNVTFAGCK